MQAAAALKAVAQGEVKDLEKAVTQTKLSIAPAYEGAEATALVAARLFHGDNTSIADQISAAQVKADQVVAAARKLLATAPTTAAVGNADKLPYAEDLL